jgi:hypothetical protein
MTDLTLLAATCEHHVRTFLAGRDLDDLAEHRGPRRARGLGGASTDPAARLRARLAGIAWPVDVTE